MHLYLKTNQMMLLVVGFVSLVRDDNRLLMTKLSISCLRFHNGSGQLSKLATVHWEPDKMADKEKEETAKQKKAALVRCYIFAQAQDVISINQF